MTVSPAVRAHGTPAMTMTAAPAAPGLALPPEVPEGTGVGRWTASLFAILAAHAGAVALVLALPAPAAIEPPPGAVMMELAALPEAPAESQPTETPPGPQQQAAEPPPELILPEPEPPPEPVFEPPPPPPEVVPEVAVPKPPPKVKPPKPEQPRPRPVKREMPPTPNPPAEQTTAPPSSNAPPGQTAAAPSAGAAGNPAARRSWQGTLLAHLERHKRYPRSSQARREQGVTHLRFVMDRQGKVLSSRIERPSGHQALDAETLELIRRAEPLPVPPPDVGDDRIELVVPVQYFLR